MLKTSNKEISVKQFTILTFILVVGAKLFSLPMLMLKEAGRSAWLPLVVFLVLDLVIICFVLITAKLAPNKTVFELLDEVFGKVVTKIILSLVVVYILFKAVLLIVQLSSFLSSNLFDGLPLFAIILPMAILLIFFGVFKLRSIGRLSEIFVFLIVPAIILLIVLTFKSAGISRLLPLFGDRGADLDSGFMLFPIFFGDALLAVFFLGKTKVNKKLFIAAPIAGFLGAAATVLYSLLVFSTFIDAAPLVNPNNVAAVTHASIERYNLGRFDKIAFVLLSVVILISLAVHFFTAVKSSTKILNIKKTGYVSIVLAMAIFFITILISHADILYFAMRFGIYFVFVFAIGIPISALICGAVYKRRMKNGG